MELCPVREVVESEVRIVEFGHGLRAGSIDFEPDKVGIVFALAEHF
jgi:hypothetical protein